MGWKDEERERQERVTAAVERLAGTIELGVRKLHEKPVEPVEQPARDLARLPGLQLALRFCRDIGRGEALVSLFKRVPEKYVLREIGKVKCPCRAHHPFSERLEQASCGRWFIGDASGVWALRLEADESAAA